MAGVKHPKKLKFATKKQQKPFAGTMNQTFDVISRIRSAKRSLSPLQAIMKSWNMFANMFANMEEATPLVYAFA